jgi:S1-C subfamily serine protease
MYRKIWKNASQSIALLSFYTHRNIKIDSLSGFMFNQFIITDSYLRQINNYDTVQISFVNPDGQTIRAKKVLTKDVFKQHLINGSDSNEGFCIVKADFSEFEEIRSLVLADQSEIEIGKSIVSIGYQLNQNNLSIKKGIISSFYTTRGNRYIQFDASVQPGNAGSPLIDAETGKVIGVIGQKLAEISKSYKRTKDIINSNIAVLKNYQGRLNIDDVDPIQVLIANQNQIKYIARELFSMANMREGFAIPSNELVNFFKKNIILEDFKPSIDALVNI